jgi:hypothetical protein
VSDVAAGSTAKEAIPTKARRRTIFFIAPPCAEISITGTWPPSYKRLT